MVDVEMKEEMLNFVPCGNENTEILSGPGIKIEAVDPLHPHHEGYYFIQCKCSVLVKRSNKSTQCNLFEEENELDRDISSASNVKDNATSEGNNNSDKSLNAEEVNYTLVRKKTVQDSAKINWTSNFLELKITSEKQLDSELNLSDHEEYNKIGKNLGQKEEANNIITSKSQEITNDGKIINDDVNNINDIFMYSSLSDSSEDEENFDELIAIKKNESYEEYCTKVDGGYKCNKCDKVVKGVNHFVSHMEHSKLCWICGNIFNNIHHISSHVATCHSTINTELPYNRRISKRSFSKRNICKVCGKKSKSELEEYDHQNIHDNVKPYQCSCGSTCRFFPNFIIHLRKFKCPVNKCIIPDYAPQNVQPWVDRETHLCKRLLERKQINRKQLLERKELNIQSIGRIDRRKVRSRRKFPDTELNCKECGIDKFLNYVVYREHLENHHLERTFVCKDKRCEKKFATERLLRDHIKKHHIIQYKCDKCNIVLSLSKYHSHRKTDCKNYNRGKITVSNYKTKFRNRLFNCAICTENEEYTMATRHFIKIYHQELEENWKEKYNINEFKCSKCPKRRKRFSKIIQYLTHLEKEHDFVFVKHINDIFKSFENHEPFILNDDTDSE